MKRSELKRSRAKKRIKRVFYAIRSKSLRPRLAFVSSNAYLSAQLIDDKTGQTLCYAATNEKSFPGKKGKNKEAALKLGKVIALRAKEKGISQIVLDRRGRLYHGRIAEFSRSAREQGLEF